MEPGAKVPVLVPVGLLPCVEQLMQVQEFGELF